MGRYRAEPAADAHLTTVAISALATPGKEQARGLPRVHDPGDDGVEVDRRG